MIFIKVSDISKKEYLHQIFLKIFKWIPYSEPARPVERTV